MQEQYHIDLSEPGLLERRTGRWLEARISGLLDRPESRLRHRLFPEEYKRPEEVVVP